MNMEDGTARMLKNIVAQKPYISKRRAYGSTTDRTRGYSYPLGDIHIFQEAHCVANEPRRHNSLRWHCPAGASGKLSSSGALYQCENEYIRWLG